MCLQVLKKYFIRVSERSNGVNPFSTREEKSALSGRPCNFLLLYKILKVKKRDVSLIFFLQKQLRFELDYISLLSVVYLCTASSRKCLTAGKNTSS